MLLTDRFVLWDSLSDSVLCTVRREGESETLFEGSAFCAADSLAKASSFDVVIAASATRANASIIFPLYPLGVTILQGLYHEKF